MNEATDVSLESDRLEQLLETAPPGQPVVMIEYRNRGFPWWMLGSVLVLVPAAVAAIFLYYHSVVEKYRAEASKAAYLLRTRAMENPSPADQPAADVAKSGPSATNAAELSMQVVGSAVPAPGGAAEAVVKPPADPAMRTQTASQDTEAPSENFTTSLDDQPRRTRPFDFSRARSTLRKSRRTRTKPARIMPAERPGPTTKQNRLNPPWASLTRVERQGEKAIDPSRERAVALSPLKRFLPRRNLPARP